MAEALFEYLRSRAWWQLGRDVLDVLVVYYIVYRSLMVLRGTRAMQVGAGLGVVFVLYIVAQLLQLVTLLSIMSAVVSSILLIIVVVFQNDIRRGLQRVGSQAWFGAISRAQESRVIDEVVEAATELARHRTGAIITFEQEANLDEFVGVHKGHIIDAKVSRELLVSMFIPEAMNKLHDGAVIIRNLRVAKAGVFYPMPEGRVVDESFGSRHRAAMGITEETDAVVVVVSEERGTISFCFNGNIASNLDGPKLRTMLEAIFSPRRRVGKKRPDSWRLSSPTSTPVEGTPREPVQPASERGSARQRPPDSDARHTTTAGDSEPPPPLRPRTMSDTTDSVHSTGTHPRLSQATTPISTRTPLALRTQEGRPLPASSPARPPSPPDAETTLAPATLLPRPPEGRPLPAGGTSRTPSTPDAEATLAPERGSEDP